MTLIRLRPTDRGVRSARYLLRALCCCRDAGGIAGGRQFGGLGTPRTRQVGAGSA